MQQGRIFYDHEYESRSKLRDNLTNASYSQRVSSIYKKFIGEEENRLQHF